ncbi:uncharacterized protein LOC105446752 [Strongylocentrotus purpuratus]|uniref:NACHT domain-containing protein n=1 Tax=Strongylocentrotus purpuratus TaxID=7668 RepID=A0A7M7PIN8_STRPU|nr:uncharacterized protein LOC105446752 [Strongylocentrotus purpuratus]
MPVSLGEWRVRIGRFVHSVREYVIRERKVKLLTERIRRLKLLQKRLLEKKEKSEDECESKPNDLSVKVDDALNESNSINSDTTHDTHKEERSRSEFTIGDEYTFPFFFTLLLSLFSLLLSLIFFFLFDFSNLLTSYKSFLKWSYCSESSWRSICLILIVVSSSLAYFVLSYVIKTNANLQDNLVLIRDENAKAESTTKLNNTPTESTIKENNTQTESAIEKNYSLTDSRIKEKNATESAKECNNIPSNATIKEINTPSITRDGPKEIKQSKTKISKRKTIKEKNTATEFNIREISTLPESTIKENIAPKECHIDTSSTMTDKPSKRKTLKRKTTKEKKTATESTHKSNNIITETTIIANNSPTESNINKDNNAQTRSTIKENNSPNGSAIKDNNAKTESTIKESSTPSTIKDKSSKRKMSRIKTVKEKIIATESHIKEDNTPIGSTINNKSASTESAIEYSITSIESTIKNMNTTTKSTIKYNNSVTESTKTESSTYSTIKDKLPKRKISKRKITKYKNTATKSKIKGNATTTESTIKEYNSSTESTIKGSNIPVKSAIKDNNCPTESTIKKNNSTAKSVNKGSNSTTECTIKNSNTPTKSTIKGNNTPTKSTIKETNTPTESPIRGNNSTSESTTIDSNTTTISAIKEDNTPSRTPTEEKNNQTMKVNIAKAEYSIRSGTQKVLSEGKHSVSSQIPSSLKGTTDDPVVQESTCLPEMILVKAGDVEKNPGPFDRAANIQEQELIDLAYDVPSSKYTNLCNTLGVSYNRSQTILDRHLLDFTRSLNAVFFEWKDRQRDGTDCRQVIATALRSVNLDALGDKMSKGGYLPQEAAPTESTVEDETQPLTKEQVDQCAQDFKTFYRTRLCKIRTDPLDFNSILEFERIYTNLVLLRNEMGTTRQMPLDYAELLTTKVNGVFPKRLMVEGEGGAGKTTFCSKMAWDWAERTKEFEEFDWVLVIPFRNTKEGQTVGDIAKTYLPDSNTVQPRQIDKYILSAPTKVFIIFDGLDEYEGDILKESSDIAKILRSEKFVECRVVVTTRPWRAVPFKSHEIMMQTFAFLAITGFDKENISIYITKYFQDDPAGYELIKYIESNDQIQENMAPFPLYIAMLCILWRTSDADKRIIIRKLKTFSQLFTAIIISLTDHCLTKQHQNPDVKILTNKEMKNYLSQIGKISYSGVLEKRLMYTENDFSGYNEAMEACCRIGVLSREILIVPRQERRLSETNPVTSSVFFPHKLFQEYLAGMYLASLFESDHEQYKMAMNGVIQRAEEFRYLLYFTASQTKNVATDVTSRLFKIGHDRRILVDVTFEAYDEDTAKVVGQHLFAEQKSLKIDDMMSAHTVSGYLFIMEKLTMETLIVSRRSCGPTVSRDLADVICSSTAFTALEVYGTALHDDFYGTLESKVKTSKVERLSLKYMAISNEQASRSLARFLNNLPRLKDLTLQYNRFDGRFYTELASGARSVEVRASGHSVRKLHLDHRCHNDILQHGFTVEMLFPNLERLIFTSSQTVSPDIVGSFGHCGLKELSFATENRQGNTKEDEEYHVPLVGDPSSLEHVFLKSFPLLTNLSFKELVIGNNRCKIILSSLKQHQHLKNLCVIHCYTDDDLDPIVSAINMENRMKVNVQHDQRSEFIRARRKLKGTKTTIQEDLTTKNQELYTKTFKCKDVLASWTSDGRIFALVKATNGKEVRKLITCTHDLDILSKAN